MKTLITKENLEVEIPSELLEIRDFKELIVRDKKRQIAKKELAYVYHMSNPSSPYYNYSDAEREKKLIADLFHGEKWKPDELVLKAIARYRDLIKTPSLHVVDSLLGSLHECNDIVIEITKQLKEDLKKGKHKSGINNRKGQIVSGVELMLNDLTALLKVSKEIPSYIDTLEKLYAKLESEKVASTSKIKGGVYISDRER